MIDFRVETFLCVCRHMSFTRAAEELHITQSAVSQQIRYLEGYYGTRLFVYEKRTLSLTPAGVRLRGCMEAMYHDTLRIRETLGGEPPVLHIGVTMSVGDFFLSDAFADYLKAHSDVHLSVTRMDTRQILSMLDNGELDFAFVEGFVRRDVYAVQTIARDDVVAVCGADYPIGEISSLNDLFKHPLLLREEGSGTRAIFDQYLNSCGFGVASFSRCSEFNSPLMIRRLLLQNCGVSVLYRSVVDDCLREGTLREIAIPNFHLTHEYSALWRPDSLFHEEYKRIVDELCRSLPSLC